MTALAIAVIIANIVLAAAAHILLITLFISVLRDWTYPWPIRVGLTIVFLAVLVAFDGTVLLRMLTRQ